jgi:branched-chain amino acid transport system substrate-binding protein
VLGYEAAEALATALQKTGGKADGLPQAIISIKNFKGVNERFSFDKYGDVVRPDYLAMIRNGKYVLIGALKPAEPRGE